MEFESVDCGKCNGFIEGGILSFCFGFSRYLLLDYSGVFSGEGVDGVISLVCLSIDGLVDAEVEQAGLGGFLFAGDAAVLTLCLRLAVLGQSGTAGHLHCVFETFFLWAFLILLLLLFFLSYARPVPAVLYAFSEFLLQLGDLFPLVKVLLPCLVDLPFCMLYFRSDFFELLESLMVFLLFESTHAFLVLLQRLQVVVVLPVH